MYTANKRLLRLSRPPSAESTTHLLLQLQNLQLELVLDLCVILLNSLQALNPSLDSRSKRVDVARRLANESGESTLDHLKESGVLWDGEMGGE